MGYCVGELENDVESPLLNLELLISEELNEVFGGLCSKFVLSCLGWLFGLHLIKDYKFMTSTQ
jgi:hypothetical protein